MSASRTAPRIDRNATATTLTRLWGGEPDAPWPAPAAPGPSPERPEQLRKQGRPHEAIAAYRAALARTPDDPAPMLALARLLAEADRTDEAVALARRAAGLADADPDLLGACAEALAPRHRAAALDLYRAAVERAPHRLDRWLAIAGIALDLGHTERAIEAAERVLRARPGQVDASLLLAVALLRRRDYARMAEVLAGIPAGVDRARAANIANLSGSMLIQQGRVAEGLAAMRPAKELAPRSAKLQTSRLMCLNYDPDLPAAELFAEHRAFGVAFAGTVAPVVRRFDHDRDPERRLRIGYVSADFRAHSVAYFMAPVFKWFDRERFDVVAYAHVFEPDEVTERLRGSATHWRDATALGDRELARRIHDDRIDILVELGGLTRGTRLLACTGRPAPVQIAYLGYPNTTGLPQIDYRITDHVADPDGADDLHTETLIRLPRCFLAFAIPNHAPEVAPPPVSRNGFVTFGSFNNLAKVNRRVVGLWAEVLRAVPGSRLLLKAAGTGDPGTRDHLGRMLGDAGVAPERVGFAGYAPTAHEHLAVYNEVDIALDTFPYNGTTTTCEALWMGVPVITLAGDRHAARVGASLLDAIGFRAGIAATPAEYVATARLLAGQPQLLAVARANLRADMLRSPLCDGRGHARALEEAYRAVWRLWCEQNPR